MFLRKTIVLVALAALTAAPSAFAVLEPADPDGGPAVAAHQPFIHRAKPAKAKVKKPAYCTPAVPYCSATR